jgi:hypothetical protein
MSSSSILAGLSVVVFAVATSPVALAQAAENVKKIRISSWEVKTTSRLIGTPMQRARPTETKHHVRNIKTNEEWLAYEHCGSSPKRVLTIRDDGTLILTGKPVTWIPWKGTPREEQLEVEDRAAHPVTAWPDGVLVCPNLLNKPNPFYFIPFQGMGKDVRLNATKQVRITDDDGTSLRSTTFLRHEGALAWLKILDGRQCDAICRYDLKTGKRDCFPLQGSSMTLSSFEGKLATLRHRNRTIVFNMVDGRSMGSSSFEALSERNGFRYYVFNEKVEPKKSNRLSFDEYRLVAIDLRSAKAEARILHKATFYSGHPEAKVVKNGIEVGDGNKRIVVPWLTR